MFHLVIGVFLTAGFFLFSHRTQKHGYSYAWWKWGLITIEFLYILFVAEMILCFLQEGAIKAAIVMGLIFGFPAIIFGVFLYRFILFPPSLSALKDEGAVHNE